MLIRPEIQGLRALAVTLVIVFHIWPTWLPGGFIGVDVFFVISGFLITQHLLKGASNTGSISFIDFWARRIRRLLPAAFFVLFCCLIITYIWLPISLWQQTFRELIGSAVYAQNWVLALDSVSYFAVENTPTLV